MKTKNFTQEELYEILRNLKQIKNKLDNSKKIHGGLCHESYLLYESIAVFNYYKLKEFLDLNKPFKVKLFNLRFWWKKGKVKPRKRWLKKYIKKLEKVLNE